MRKPYRPGLPDLLPVYGGLLTGLFMVGFPVWQIISSGKFQVPVLAVFGLILLGNSLADLLRFRKLKVLQPGQKQWLLRHISLMGGAYIATFTAFAVTNIRIEQQWLIWLLPTVIGSMLIGRAIHNWRKKLNLNPASVTDQKQAANQAFLPG